MQTWLSTLSAPAVTLSADIAVAAGVVLAGLLVAGRLRANNARQLLRDRLVGLERGMALLDRVSALSYEIEDRYAKRDGPSEADIPAILALRRDMALAMAEARAALEVHGELGEASLPEDVLLVTVRPVVENPPTLGADPRSLERLRAMLVRLRFESGDVCMQLRRRLGYRPHGARRI